MAPKQVKTQNGRLVVLKSVLLENGNLLIPQKFVAKDGSRYADWVEVEPGTSNYKRWFTVMSEEPDPRLTEEYVAWKAGIQPQEPVEK